MNTPSNAMLESQAQSQVGAAAEIPMMRRIFWALRREFWESRSLYLAPLGVAGLFLLGFAISTIHLPSQMSAAAALDPVEQREAIAMPYDIAGGLMMLIVTVVGAFYSLDALYSERRDRSIFFWKSLPISDMITVLAKASVPIIILPLLGFAIVFIAESLMLLLSSTVLAASGLSITNWWTQLSFFRMSFLLLYHLVTGHGLWYAPLYAWLLLISAWARRAPFLWAFLPPIALCYLEKVAFNSTHLTKLLMYRLAGGMEAVYVPGSLPMNPMTHPTPGRFLETPGLWIGLAFAAACLLAAARLRRDREPI
jgi:ABC-2 type transport system permease protein